MPITRDSFIIPAPESEVVFCDLDGEIALLHLARGTYFGLNATGARVWHLLGSGRVAAAVSDALAAEFEVEAARCEADLLALLTQIAAAGLVTVRA